jgi:hypothetical protein
MSLEYEQNTAISGAACKIYMGATLVGRAVNVSASQNTEQFPIKILGDIDTVEFEAVDRNVTVNAGMVKIRKNSLFDQNVFPRGNTGDPVTSTAEVIKFPEMTWVIFDVVNQEVVWTLEGVVGETHSWSLDRGNIMMYNCSFRARKMIDNTGS